MCPSHINTLAIAINFINFVNAFAESEERENEGTSLRSNEEDGRETRWSYFYVRSNTIFWAI